LKLTALAVLILPALLGCSSMHLGDIDETIDARDDMPGPGILTNAKGETPLSWSSDQPFDNKNPKPDQASKPLDKRDEFELFKQWQALRQQGVDSADYQEFQQWLRYQRFKQSQ